MMGVNLDVDMNRKPPGCLMEAKPTKEKVDSVNINRSQKVAETKNQLTAEPRGRFIPIDWDDVAGNESSTPQTCEYAFEESENCEEDDQIGNFSCYENNTQNLKCKCFPTQPS